MGSLSEIWGSSVARLGIYYYRTLTSKVGPPPTDVNKRTCRNTSFLLRNKAQQKYYYYFQISFRIRRIERTLLLYCVYTIFVGRERMQVGSHNMKITRDESSDQDVRRNQEHGYSGISPIKVHAWYVILTAHLGFSRFFLSNKSTVDFPISYSDVAKPCTDNITWI